MLADKSASAPGAISDKVDPTVGWCDRVFRQLQAEGRDEFLDTFERRQALFSTQIEQDEVIDITAIHPRLELPLDEMIKRVEVDQSVGLRQQVADRDTNCLAVLGKQHEQINKTTVLDLVLDLAAQHIPIDPVEKLADVEFDRVAISA